MEKKNKKKQNFKKNCVICGAEFWATRTIDILCDNPECKKERRKQNKKRYYWKDIEKTRKKRKERYWDDPEKYRLQARKNRSKHRDKRIAANKEWAKNNPDKVSASYHRNKHKYIEIHKERNNEYYKKNKEEILTKFKEQNYRYQYKGANLCAEYSPCYSTGEGYFNKVGKIQTFINNQHQCRACEKKLHVCNNKEKYLKNPYCFLRLSDEKSKYYDPDYIVLLCRTCLLRYRRGLLSKEIMDKIHNKVAG